MSQRRRKSERTKNLHFQGLFAYSEKFSKIKPSGNMYIMKGIFSDQIIFMVHIPFKYKLSPIRPELFLKKKSQVLRIIVLVILPSSVPVG